MERTKQEGQVRKSAKNWIPLLVDPPTSALLLFVRRGATDADFSCFLLWRNIIMGAAQTALVAIGLLAADLRFGESCGIDHIFEYGRPDGLRFNILF